MRGSAPMGGSSAGVCVFPSRVHGSRWRQEIGVAPGVRRAAPPRPHPPPAHSPGPAPALPAAPPAQPPAAGGTHEHGRRVWAGAPRLRGARPGGRGGAGVEHRQTVRPGCACWGAAPCRRLPARARAPLTCAASAAVVSSHTVMAASAPPVATRPWPRPATASAHTLASCASKVLAHSPLRPDHSFSSPSPPTDSTWGAGQGGGEGGGQEG